MFFCSSKLKVFVLLTAMVGMLLARNASALDKNEEALAKMSSAMDAYSNLEMDRAEEMLEGALALDELENDTLAKIHASLGVISISGFSRTAEGQSHFIQAVCLDEEIKVDALYSTPEIDLVFSQARELATPEKCNELGISKQPVGPSIASCGDFTPPERHKRSHEVPFNIKVKSEFRNQINHMVLHYAFDSGGYSDLDLSPTGFGYGAKLECDLHDIRRMNPSEIVYYIEGFSRDGDLVCGQGSEEYPLFVEMDENARPWPGRGLNTEFCERCDDDDLACKERLAAQKRGDGKQGDPCTTDTNCVMGLMCDPEMFVCTSELIEKEPESASLGHEKFYVALTGGTGGGFVNKSIHIKKTQFPEEGNENYDPRNVIGAPYDVNDAGGMILSVNNDAKGWSWSGIPIRLAMGVHITPKLSLEVSGRLDVFIISNSEPVSCWDASGHDIDQMLRDGDPNNDRCSFDFDGDFEDKDRIEMGKVAMSWVPNPDDPRVHDVVLKKKYQFAWLVNARARYRYLTTGSFVGSVFGGVGYGHIQYRVKDTASGRHYFPMPGMVDIEVGAGFAYYFSKNAGLVVDIPLDFIVGDGFAFNADLNLGVSVGF